MKNKLALLALACGLSFAANAQIVQEEETLKPVAGNKTMEASINFSGGTSGQIKLRKFTSEQKAFRFATGIGYNYDKLTDDAHRSSLTISFAPGIEKHFSGTKRLSPYLGFAVPLSARISSYKADRFEVTGATSTSGNDRSYFSVGATGLAGFDFYVAKNFYVGIEAGVGLSYLKYAKAEAKFKNDFTQNTTLEGYHGVNFSTFTNSALRVGFAF